MLRLFQQDESLRAKIRQVSARYGIDPVHMAGAIIGVLPGQVGVAVVSPRLNEHGNSVRGVAVFERLSRDLELHMMHVSSTGQSAIRAVHDREESCRVELQGDLRWVSPLGWWTFGGAA